ncbi:MAG: hypothetical protein R8K46_10655 [Mariprofundaceae bacterium]
MSFEEKSIIRIRSLRANIMAVAMVAALALLGLQAEAQAASLEKVQADKVCMTNDAFFGTPQIPVEVAGKTYYGCCQGCAATLKNEVSSRTAVDPVTGKNVDKATAVIGMLPGGSVLYFESEATFKAYSN